MLKEIEALSQKASKLESTIEERKDYTDQIFTYLEESQPYEGKVFTSWNAEEEIFSELPVTDHSKSFSTLVNYLKDQVYQFGLNAAHGGHMAYIPGGGLYTAGLADWLAATQNRYSSNPAVAPGAVGIHNQLLRWLCQIVGYPETAWGDLTSGGTLATLTALTVARQAKKIAAKDFSRTVVYLTTYCHHSVKKALRVIMADEVLIREVPTSADYRLDVEQLEQLILQDKQTGLIPWLVVATAGTVDTGTVDPLTTIAEIANRYGLWFHIDAAYGGFFVLTSSKKKLLEGMKHADSIILDPHKSLFLPYGMGVVLVKDGGELKNAMQFQAHYRQDAQLFEYMKAPTDYSLELTRPFRALRLWLPLQLFGVETFRAALEEKLLLAQYAYQQLQNIAGIKIVTQPDLSIIAFRYCLPSREDEEDQQNQKLLQSINQDGRVFLSSTRLNGKFTLRMAILCVRTHLKIIQETLELLREKIQLLQS